ncbi:peptidoglycan glycosyltransferase [Iodidimonas nitroreducens]|uniref:Peptidoglycan glycosyltransferase n=1 Tax=Iodidimonas nitroreducens TaxID=1236968 RepID=A0A5A7NBT9_9PROT|nr:penicillin-binding protein 2 [Iodidimonas nitroreducens]GAK33116.1 penicillin-binding protein 2 [alpha proteobacterium Q-1]GER05085.1 peptidoglycan glycosyltransferase [Iodidimonas nitroreducens]
MASDTSRFKTFSRRAALLAGAQGLLTAVLAGRLYYLGVVEADQYEMLAEENRISIRMLAPHRGDIVDRFGETIASNRQDYRVFLIPEQSLDVRLSLQRLGQIIHLTERDLRRVETQIARQRKFLPVTVAQGLSWEDFAKINVSAPDLAGIQPDSGLSRWYPDGPVASQIVGYVGSASEEEMDGDPLLTLPGFKIGKRGVERSYDRILRGRAGSSRVEVNAYGRTIRELGRTEGIPGDQVALTIDMGLQRAIAKRLGEEAAGVVVMDIDTGDIYAHVSTPSYDPNSFNLGISRENWAALLRDPRKPLVDKCISGQYPPGSVFKMVVALAALHHKIITPEKTIYCNGRHRLGDNVWHCWRREGHGAMNMEDALARSCDVYFYTIAHELGIERLAQWAQNFGLGQVFDLEVGGESSGLVPTPGWKIATTGEPWMGGETLNVGIGQGALLATPVQLAVMTARLANGGYMVRPRLVRAIGPDARALPAAPNGGWPKLDFAGDHLAVVRRGMEKVLEYRGTAYRSRLSWNGMTMAGKTGTAQVRRITREMRDNNVKQEDLPWQARHHAWFVAYAPADKPRYACCVLIEHGGGGASAAAPVARDVMAQALERDPAGRPALDQMRRALGAAQMPPGSSFVDD